MRPHLLLPALLTAVLAAPAFATDTPKEIVIEPDSLSPAPDSSSRGGKSGRHRDSEAASDSGGGGTQRGLWWEVTSTTGTKGRVFLFGAIHVASPAAYPLPSAAEKAFEKSSALVVEADVTRLSASQIAQKFRNHGNFPPGVQSLRKSLPSKCYETVAKTADEMGLAAHTLNDMKPWFAAVQLEGLEAAMAGLNPDLGIDVHFLHEAKGRKRILELEGVDAQIDLFNDLPQEQQVAMLCVTAREAKSFESDAKRMFKAWSSGDASGLASIIDETNSQDSNLKPAMDAIFTNRNKEMAEKIQKYLEGDSTYFVVVGAGHLVGSTGIPALLQTKQDSVVQH